MGCFDDVIVDCKIVIINDFEVCIYDYLYLSFMFDLFCVFYKIM